MTEEDDFFDEWDRQGWPDPPSMDAHMRCCVCGLRQKAPPWGPDGQSPTYDFCACCGIEFGYQDASLTGALAARRRWLDAGAQWSEPNERPDGWDAKRQLAAIPEEWRGPLQH